MIFFVKLKYLPLFRKRLKNCVGFHSFISENAAFNRKQNFLFLYNFKLPSWTLILQLIRQNVFNKIIFVKTLRFST